MLSKSIKVWSVDVKIKSVEHFEKKRVKCGGKFNSIIRQVNSSSRMAWHSTACFISCKTRFSSYLFSFLFLPHSLLRSCVFLINNHHTKMRFLCLHREKKVFFVTFFCAALACFNSSAAVFFGMIWDDALFYCQNYCRHIDLNCSIIYHNYALLASNAGIYLFFCFCWSSLRE